MLKDIIAKCVLGEYSQDAAEHRAKLALAAEKYKTCPECGDDLTAENILVLTMDLDPDDTERATCHHCFIKHTDALVEMLKKDPLKEPGHHLIADSWEGQVTWSLSTGEHEIRKEYKE